MRFTSSTLANNLVRNFVNVRAEPIVFSFNYVLSYVMGISASKNALLQEAAENSLGLMYDLCDNCFSSFSNHSSFSDCGAFASLSILAVRDKGRFIN